MPDQKALESSVPAEHKQVVGKRIERRPDWIDKNLVGVQMSFETGWHDSAPDFAVSCLDHGCRLAGW